MRSRVIVTVLAAISVALSAGTAVAGEPDSTLTVPGAWWETVQRDIRESEYQVTWQDRTYLADLPGAWHAPNRAHGFRTYFTKRGIRVVPRTEAEPSWEWGLALVAWGRRGGMRPAGGATLVPGGNRIDYARDAIAEWYVNGPDGLEQGFTIGERPEDSRGAPLSLDLELSGSLSPVLSGDGQAVDFATPGGRRVVRFAQLVARDASGRELPARFEGFAENLVRGIRIVIEEAGASYPLTVDPLATSPAWTKEVNQVDAHFGYSVASAGDVHGTPFTSIIIGAPEYDNGQIDEGRVYVYYGDTTGPATNPAWRAESDKEGARLGFCVSAVGDVNGDGYGDIMAGAPYWEESTVTDEGLVWLWYGNSDALGGLPDTPSWSAKGAQVGAQFGYSVSAAGDVDGDGYADVVAGAPNWDNGQLDEGGAFVWYGSASGLGAAGTPWDADWRAEGNLASAALGRSVCLAGDVNGDGYSDVIVGASSYSNVQSGEGAAFAWYGSSTGLGAYGTPSNADWRVESNQDGAALGLRAGTAGDVNGDGYSDVIVGTPYYDNGQTDEGRASVYLGSSTGLSGTAGWHAESDESSARYAYAVGTAGDVNGDGYSDIVVGADRFDGGTADQGRVYVYYGDVAGLSPSPAWTADGGQAGALLGFSAATAGDTNGDGFSDLILGAPYYDNGQSNEGRVLVYLGGPEGLESSLAKTIPGPAAEARLGSAVAPAGDVNGDGYADFLAASLPYDNGQTDEGAVFLYCGSASGPSTTPSWHAESDQASAFLGVSIAGAGDVNGDGYGDVILGTYQYDAGLPDVGAAFVWYGSSSGLGANGTPANADWTATGDQTNGAFGISVATAGDVNGDGIGDIIVGADRYTSSASAEGGLFIWLGSLAGLGPNGTPSNADWVAKGGQAGLHLGATVSSAGDVNWDGFSDVIAGADGYSSPEAQEGAAFAWYGSPTGLGPEGNPANARWHFESNEANAQLWTVAAAGDVNGDGYSDVIVGAPLADFLGDPDHGTVWEFDGSASGLESSPSWQIWGGSASAFFGDSLASAGDVNGDGFADVIVGEPGYDNAGADIGAAVVFHGSAAGLSQAWSASGSAAGDRFGSGVASAGDVNGDGFADVIVGSSGATTAIGTRSGKVTWCYGGGGAAQTVLPRQLGYVSGGPIARLGRSDDTHYFKMAAKGHGFLGRGEVKLEWDVERDDTPFTDLYYYSNLGWSDSGTAGVDLTDYTGSEPNHTSHWRVRVRYRITDSPFQQWGRWMTQPWGGWNEADLRVWLDTDGDDVDDRHDNCAAQSNPDQADADADGSGDVCDTCTDTDEDGYGDPGFPANTCPEDQAPSDPGLWTPPTDPQSLGMTKSGTNNITWSAPENPGGVTTYYDVLRSGSPDDFGSASCVETDGTDLVATDTTDPKPAGKYYYLIRSENSLGSDMGERSDGTLRTGRSCP